MKAGQRLLAGVVFLLVCVHLHAQTPDPLNQWQVIATPAQSIRGMAYKGGTFVAVGFSTNIVVSTNGSDWFQVSSGLTNGGLYAVAEGAEKFVAVGPGNYRATILGSSNGLEWTKQFVHTNEEYWAVTYGGGQFVAVGFPNYGPNPNYGSVALTSIDGLQWLRFPMPYQTTPRNVVYGNGVYLAAGALLSLYSTNGRDWTALTLNPVQSVAFGAGVFVASVGNNAHGTYRSSNGVDWTEVSMPASPAMTFYTAGYANGTFVLAGDCSCSDGTRPVPIATSINGIDWIFRTFTNDMRQLVIRDMVFVDGSFYAGDQTGGRIWKSGRMRPSERPVITRAARSGGEMSLSFTAVPGFRYAIERTDDLDAVAWVPWLVPVFATSESISVNDSAVGNDSRFYRIRTQ